MPLMIVWNDGAKGGEEEEEEVKCIRGNEYARKEEEEDF